ncbi:MAG: RDD family protein [Paracoccaceae bacterium]|nr:RDD family protein [Paracoccaceae bacterium]
METTPISRLPDPAEYPAAYRGVLIKRFFAFLIDSMIITLILLALIPLTAFIALFFLGIIAILLNFFYRSISLTNRSATPGMRMMGIEFRDNEAQRFSSGMAMLHTLLFMLCMSTMVPQLVSVIMMLVSSRSQGLYDLFLGTAVVNRPPQG